MAVHLYAHAKSWPVSRLVPHLGHSPQALDWVIDGFFICDILMIFNTSYYEDEELIHDRKRIACRYVKGWFPIDLVATLPWELLVSRWRSVLWPLCVRRTGFGGVS